MAPALSQCGLRLLPSDWRTATVAIGLSIAGVTAFVIVLDCVLFRSQLAPSYVELYTSALIPRTLMTCLQAIFEEIECRLLVMTLLALTITAIWKRTLPSWCFILIIIASQFASVGAFVLHDPLYASLRYLAVGSVWGWLYWRYGWVSGLLGHATTHLLLDPLLLVGLR
jgi:membrane protease YdiL (CAAX protease family)